MSKSRVHWKHEELVSLAKAMMEVLKAGERVSLISALRQAQEKVLSEDRWRNIKAWSMVEAELGPLLEQERKAGDGGSAAEVGAGGSVAPGKGVVACEPMVARDASDEGQAVSEVAQRGEDAQCHESAKKVDETVKLDGATVALTMEAALVAALQSKAVELAFSQMLERALSRSRIGEEAGASGSRRVEAGQDSGVRVLVAGFPAPAAKHIEDELRGRFDVRRWVPNQGPQLFETLAKMCSIAVIPEESDDEFGQALEERQLRVVRHAGAASRLTERLQMLNS